MNKSFSQGYIIAIIGTVLWSSTGVFIRYLTTTIQVPPLVIAFWRDLFVAVLLAVIFTISRRQLFQINKEQISFLALYGFLLACFNSLWTVSVAFNGAAVSTVLAYSSAAYTALLERLLYKIVLSKRNFLVICLSLTGCVLVSGAYSLTNYKLNPVGLITGVLSGLLFSVYSLMGKSSSNRKIAPWSTVFYTFGFAAVFLLFFNIIPPVFLRSKPPIQLFVLGSNWAGWVLLLTLAIVPTIGGYGLYTVSLTHLQASAANIIATLEPVFTGVQASLFIGEQYTVIQIFGSLFILSGVIILNYSERAKFQTND